jgi:hypothetical protein
MTTSFLVLAGPLNAVLSYYSKYKRLVLIKRCCIAQDPREIWGSRVGDAEKFISSWILGRVDCLTSAKKAPRYPRNVGRYVRGATYAEVDSSTRDPSIRWQSFSQQQQQQQAIRWFMLHVAAWTPWLWRQQTVKSTEHDNFTSSHSTTKPSVVRRKLHIYYSSQELAINNTWEQ